VFHRNGKGIPQPNHQGKLNSILQLPHTRNTSSWSASVLDDSVVTPTTHTQTGLTLPADVPDTDQAETRLRLQDLRSTAQPSRSGMEYLLYESCDDIYFRVALLDIFSYRFLRLDVACVEQELLFEITLVLDFGTHSCHFFMVVRNDITVQLLILIISIFIKNIKNKVHFRSSRFHYRS
jgi:hypothetical protein